MAGSLSLRELVAHPFTLATTITGVAGGLLHLPLVASLWTALVAQSGTLFGGVSIFAFTIAPETYPQVATWLQPVAIVLGALYGGSKLYRALKNIVNDVK
ncbi:hypothetical protein NKF26_12105 [Haladaptatus sp. AB618]|uniref:hypothetical protein n=1 Tax=Haladaptatus sp. AB618 TaxID=2934173 RepID=UPI00209BFB9A|nr:hypothetical protein [Haladaptatus sp. AB618]MCO8254546.1 hypothetical protein [Haladaptatus sp. AB618]